ncbi:sensor histidine kinase [Actinomadura madurae]|uniref:sensor histidine kinase n=1 Tax=Actinomadura madurae TaxID=1993 RepID=UPI0020D2016B|nr:histidine kinase [Actinomadura madurae]MCP9953273.1 histidine kinase [Actinomadura madurae]MCP9982490.1 histidine kinase [Actinomadura madurae]MCQ0005975.1 histidine kinase [Actinomadura madurae]
MWTGLPGLWARSRDWVIAVGLAAMLLGTALAGEHPATDFDALGYALVVASGLALAAGRRAPVPVLVVTALCSVGYQAAGFDVPAVAYLFAVYAAVRSGHRVVTLAVSVALLTVLPVAVLLSPDGGSWRDAFMEARGVLELAWLIAAAAAGEALRQAERRADEAERTREEAARLRASEERLHIARELHDSLTHQISIIKVQSGVAVHLARKRGEEVPEALLAIQEAGREANRELRATLDTLRNDARTPSHGLDHVPHLVERARGTGLETTLTVEGRRPTVPVEVDRTAYRIVQEALTNTARHAAATTASIRIHYRPDALAIRVDDDGKAEPGTATVPGAGLLGMRERVTALGGRLRAEPRSEGGFSVQAELPVGRPS